MVGARLGVEAGVKIRIDLPAAIYHDIVGEEHVQLIHEALQVDNRFRFEVCVEVACVDSGVGAAASCDGNILFQFEADAFFEHFLNADVVRLNLPAVIGLPVICQM